MWSAVTNFAQNFLKILWENFLCEKTIFKIKLILYYNNSKSVNTYQCLDTCPHKIKFVLTLVKNDWIIYSTVVLLHLWDLHRYAYTKGARKISNSCHAPENILFLQNEGVGLYLVIWITYSSLEFNNCIHREEPLSAESCKYPYKVQHNPLRMKSL